MICQLTKGFKFVEYIGNTEIFIYTKVINTPFFWKLLNELKK